MITSKPSLNTDLRDILEKKTRETSISRHAAKEEKNKNFNKKIWDIINGGREDIINPS